MANTLKIGVENADELLNAGQYDAGALIQLQSSATEAGVFADLTGTGSTPTLALVAGTFSYTGYDPSGASTTWYRTRYKNSAATRTSDWSAAFQAAAEGSGLIASLYDAKQRLEIAYTDTAQDENVLEWLGQVASFIHGYCGRSFTPNATTIYTFDGYSATRKGYCLPVPMGVQSLSLLAVAPNTGGTFATVNAADYFLRPAAQDRSPGWPATEIWMTDVTVGAVTPYFYPGFGNVRGTGVFGWASIPAEVQGVALTLLVSAARERGAGGGDSVTVGLGGERTFERALGYKDRQTLNRYRIYGVG